VGDLNLAIMKYTIIATILIAVTCVIYGRNIFDDEFDPIFRKTFKPGSKWILRIKPRSVDGQKQWVVSYYQTAHLHLIGDHVTGSILKHHVEKKMKYSHFKTLLMREIEKNRTNNHGAGGGK